LFLIEGYDSAINNINETVKILRHKMLEEVLVVEGPIGFMSTKQKDQFRFLFKIQRFQSEKFALL
jgi:hypothetical protein